MLQPPEVMPTSPVYMLPGQLDRVRAACPGSTLGAELDKIRAPFVEHAAVERRMVRGALVNGTDVLSLRGRLPGLGMRGAVAMVGRWERWGRVLYAGTPATQRWFGHWVHDGLSTALLGSGYEAVTLPTPSGWQHAFELDRALGFGVSRPLRGWVDELSYCIDYGQGSLKRARYARLREDWRIALGSPPRRSGHRVYLRRGDRGEKARRLEGAARFEDELRGYGFRVVDHLEHSATELARELLDAEVVVSVDGSHVVHALMAMKAGGVVISLVEADRFTTNLAGIVDGFGMRNGLVVLEGTGSTGYRVDVAEVLRTLDRALAG